MDDDTLQTRMSARPLRVRSVEERIIEGRLVPYGETIVAGGRRERFTRGAFAGTAPDSVTLKIEHDGLPVGRSIEITEDDTGASGVFTVARTTRGDEILELAASGTMRGVSIGFIPDGSRLVDGVTEHRKVSLVEASIVERPAYSGAAVTNVRSKEDLPMNDTTPDTVVETTDAETETRAALELRAADLEARIKTLEARPVYPGAAETEAPSTVDPLDWFAAELRSVVLGDDTEKRALADMVGVTGGTGGAEGIVPGAFWPGGLINVLDTRRPMFANAGRIPYPSAGTTVALPHVTQQPTVATRGQKAEAESTAMLVGLINAPIVFGAGAQNVALELIAQSNPAALGILWDSLLAAYAGWTESLIESAIAADGTAGGAGLDLSSLGTFVGDVVAGAQTIRAATGSPGDQLALPTDDWIKFLALTDGGDRRQLATMGATNADGSASLIAEAVQFAGINVFHAPLRVTGAAAQFNAASLKSADSGPQRIESVNVSQIGRDVAVWGGAIAEAIVPAGVLVYSA